MTPSLTIRPTRGLLAFCLWALLTTALFSVPPAAADCHTDPARLVHCTVSDVLGAKEHYADALTGAAFTTLDASTHCDGEDIAWDDWTTTHDATCGGQIHAFSATYGAADGELAFVAGSDAGNVRVVLGQLIVGDTSHECIPAEGGNGRCEIHLGVLDDTAACLKVSAVSHLNTGTTQEVEMIGPWTHC